MSLEGALAVTRFGLGARYGDLASASNDPHAWLDRQLTNSNVMPFPVDGLNSSKVNLSTAITYARSARTQRANEDTQRNFRRTARQTTRTEIARRTAFAVETATPFHERLVRFWSNHFTVAMKSPPTRLVAGAYEREAIRPNILGSFSELAINAIFHAGMLVYLDNWQSIGPNSRVGRRRQRGLNENLAREVLELHTVTPQAGYSQDDVTAFSEALTGWTVGNQRVASDRLGEPVFVEFLHEPGRKSVLSKRYSDTGADQAKAIVRDLCLSPYTANNIAFKIARHFVADEPPATLVTTLADNFMRTGGNLTSLYTTLIGASETWLPSLTKIKTPDELIVSTGRLLGLRRVLVGDPGNLFESFAQTPFTAPSPEGWPDDAAAWITPDAMKKRIEWANRLATRNPTLDARALLDNGLGDRVSSETARSVMRAESQSQAVVLALMSPDFQMR